MRIKNKTKFVIVFILVLLLTSVNFSFAAGEKLTDVIVELGINQVVVDIDQYAFAYMIQDASPLYRYLKGDMEKPHLTGVASGRKFMSINKYAFQYMVNLDVSKAIQITEKLEDINGYVEFIEFNESGKAITQPIAV